jgi:hypothetical protein
VAGFRGELKKFSDVRVAFVVLLVGIPGAVEGI